MRSVHGAAEGVITFDCLPCVELMRADQRDGLREGPGDVQTGRGRDPGQTAAGRSKEGPGQSPTCPPLPEDSHGDGSGTNDLIWDVLNDVNQMDYPTCTATPLILPSTIEVEEGYFIFLFLLYFIYSG